MLVNRPSKADDAQANAIEVDEITDQVDSVYVSLFVINSFHHVVNVELKLINQEHWYANSGAYGPAGVSLTASCSDFAIRDLSPCNQSIEHLKTHQIKKANS